MYRVLLYVVLLIFLLFSSFGVSAMSGSYSPDVQSTSTRDIRTPPGTPTPGGDTSSLPTAAAISYECPLGLPIGYGTVTPGAMWGLICEACIPTNTPFPTYDFNEVIPTRTARFCEMFPLVDGCWTPTPTSTAPTSTPTATGTPNYVCGGSETATPFPTATYSYSGGTVENTSGTITYTGSWTTNECGVCADNSQTLSKTAGRKFSYTFFGDGISLYLYKYNGAGKAEIRMDGNLIATEDLYQSAAGAYTEYFYAVSAGTHTIELTVTGTKNASSSDAWVHFDYLQYDGLQYPTPTNTVGGVDCESSGAGYTCIEDTSMYAALVFSGSSPGAGGDRNVQFNLTPNVTQQITYKVTVLHNEISSFSSNQVGDQIDIETSAGTDITIGFVESEEGTNVTGSEVFYGFASVVTHSSNNNLVFHLGTASDFAITGGSLDFLVEVWAYVQCELVTSTPDGTATPGAGYCFSISDDVPSGDDVEFWEPSGEASCYIIPALDGEVISSTEGIIGFLWDSFVVVFGETFLGVLTPAMTVCIQPYDFTDFNFFGIAFAWSWFMNLFIISYVLSHLARR